ncbi:MAG: phage gp6-like head-tail connector protein, partial [Clostridia bacterium]|nr:phage gp6-like head-tail connector protein [Clostridia bacterium]
VADYLRIAELTEDDENFITSTISVAIDYILKYTGIEDAETLDNYTDMVIAVFVLVQSMYDVRAYEVDTSNVNRVVDTILGMHQRNLL